MNSASTAKVPQVARFRPWYESPNANAFAGPKIAGETLVPALSSLVLADIDDSQNAQFKNRTASIGEDDVYAPRYGYVQTRAKGHIDVLNAYAPSMRFGNLEMAISEPTVVNLFVATGDNSTFNLPVIGTSFQQELADLRSMVLAINQGATLRRSGQFEDLLNRALARTGTPRDIDNWARRLAENVVNLDD